MDTWSFPGVKIGRGVTLTLHLLLVPWSRKSRAIPLLPLCAGRPVQSLSACTVQLYLYSPYLPDALYIAPLPVQYSYTSTPPMCWTACTEPQCLYSTAIPLLPLFAGRPVQSPIACTVQLYLYSPYVPDGLYRASVPVQGCTLPFFYPQNNWEPALLFAHSALKFHNLLWTKNNLCLTSQVLFVYLHTRNISDTNVWLSRFLVFLFL